MKTFYRFVQRWGLFALGGIGVASITMVIAVAYQQRPGAAVLTIDATQQFQTIRGWEALAEAGLESTTSQEYINELLDATVDLGLTRLRVEVRSGYEHTRNIAQEYRDGVISNAEFRCTRYATINDNDDAFSINWRGFRFERLDGAMEALVLPLRQRLAEHGVRLWINVNYVAFTNQLCEGHRYLHDRPDEYAEFVLATYQHLRDKYGVTPDSWEVMLEPDNTREWTKEAMAEAMVRTARRLQQAGFTPSFVAPSTTLASNALNFARSIWSRETLRPLLREVSYHRYDSPGERIISDIGSFAAQNGLETAMLEKLNAGHHELHQDLTLGRVSAWQQYALAFPPPQGRDGVYYFNLRPDAPEGSRVTLMPSARYLRQYFRALRPDARRIGATSDNEDFKPVAVRQHDGRLAVVVSANRGGQLTIRQLEPGSYRVSCWTERSTLGDVSSQCDQTVQVISPGTLIINIPAAGVLSLAQNPTPSP